MTKLNTAHVMTLSVGNTHTRLLVWMNGKIGARLQWETARPVPASVPKLLRGAQNVTVIVSSVVPAAKNRVVALLEKNGAQIFVFRREIKPRIQIVPSPARRVGDDRIAAALGALSIDDGRPWVVVDFGTATTINAVSPGRTGKFPRFEGGLILPSPHLSLLALAQHTAQLPALQEWTPAPGARTVSIGRNTREAMRWGVWQAHAAAVAALVKTQMNELGARTLVAATGGRSEYLTRKLSAAFPAGQVIPSSDLVHLGLLRAWSDHAR